MKNTVNIILTAALLCAASWSFAAPDAKAVEGQVRKSAAAQQRAYAEGLSTVRATWERCDVLVSRPRCNGKARVRVKKTWTCKDVTTTCGAVVKEGKAYASAACYYVEQGKKESVSLKDALLIDSAGKNISLLKKQTAKVKEFVVFHLS